MRTPSRIRNGEFNCRHCDKCYDSDSKRKVHVRRSHQQRTKCAFYSKCNEETSEYITVDRVDGLFKCPRCNAVFSDPKYLRKHTRSCHYQQVSAKNGSPMHTKALSLLDGVAEYNPSLSILICGVCRHVINATAEKVARHLRIKHGTVLGLEKIKGELAPLSFGDLPQEYREPSRKLKQAVDGIELKSGFSCGICVYYTPLKPTMLKHFRMEHPNIAAPRYSSCMVQSFYVGPRTKYFGVVIHDDQPVFQDSEINDAITNMIRNHSNSAEYIPPSDDRLVSPFLRQFRWHEIVQKSCTQDISALTASVRFNSEAELVKLVYPVVCRYWEIGQGIIGTKTYLFERLFSSPGSEIVSVSQINRIQESEVKYCQTLTSLILMVKNHAVDKSLIQNRVINKVIVDMIDALTVSCSHGNRHMIRIEQLKQLDDVLESIFRMDLECDHEPSEFHAFPTHRFVICKSISGVAKDAAGGVQFKKPGQITSLVAILKYWARLSAMMNIHQRVWGVPPTETNMATVKRAEELRYFLKVEKRTPFSLLQEVMSFGSSIAMAPEERRIPQLAYLKTGDTVLIDGHHVSIGNLKELGSQLISQFHSAMHANVLMGFDTSKIKGLLQAQERVFHDDYSNCNCGYSFLDDDRNPWIAIRTELVKFLLSCHRSIFVVHASVDEVKLQRDAVLRWCNQVENLTKLLIPLIFVTSGQPSRASELSATTIRNTVSGERSVYMIGDQVMVVQRYHKGQSKSGQHRVIARFLPRKFTLDFIIFLALVRPTLDFFSKYLTRGDSDDKADVTYFYLFSSHTEGQLNGKSCRSAINAAFLRSGMDISVRHYRHIAIAFMEKHIKIDRMSRDVLDLQAAHSSYTASTLYSRATTDPYFMSRDDLWEFRSTSEQWHCLLDLGESDYVANRSQNPSDGTSIEKDASETFSRVVLATNDAVTPARPVTVVVRPFPRIDINKAMRCLLPSHFSKARSALREFFRDNTANFRSTEQCTAMALIIQNVTNLLIVLPTNGGKSLLYQLAAFCNPLRVIVVVVPLVALLVESVEKTRRLGINCEAYNDDMNPHVHVPSILYVGVDYLERSKFRAYLSSLHQQKRVSKVFFDEAHLVLTSREYRRCMDHVGVLALIGVQKVLLSATLPMDWESELASRFGIDFATLRTLTTRPLLRYAVTQVATLEDMKQSCLSIVKVPVIHPDKGIVFAFTKADVERLAEFLSFHTEQKILTYHSDMNRSERTENIRKWKSDTGTYIVATCGFGQGVDYPHVRTVIHYGLAHSLIDFVQETGRAGRDNQPADCITIYSDSYRLQFESAFSSESPSLDQMRAFFVDKYHCRRQRLQEAMDLVSLPCTANDSVRLCDVCSGAISTNISTRPAPDSSHRQYCTESALANQRRRDDEVVYLALQHVLFNDRSEYCVVCWVSNPLVRKEHGFRQCPHQMGRCFKCLDIRHAASGCANRLVFDSRSTFCFLCGLPLADVLGKSSLHFGSSPGIRCSTRLRGKMIPGAWRFYELCQTRRTSSIGLEAQIECLTRLEFSEWLVKRPVGSVFNNLCILWVHILDRSKQLPVGSW